MSSNYYSPTTASYYNPYQQQQQQQQQQSFFPSPSSTVPNNFNSVPDSNYYSTTTTDNVYDNTPQDFDESSLFSPTFPLSNGYQANNNNQNRYNNNKNNNQRSNSSSNNNRSLRQLQTQWNSQVSSLLGASHLYLQASAWLRQPPHAYPGMAAALQQRSDALRGGGLELMDRGFQTNGVVEVEIPKPQPQKQQQQQLWTLKTSNRSSVADVWQQLLAAELALSESTGMLVNAAADITGYFDPAIVMWLESTYSSQVQQTQQVGEVVDYVRGVQQDDVSLRRFDGQFRI
jgi:ferritin